ncbi:MULTISPECIES: relaxase/mobilization nuclease domain-containing protein [unclassified Chitinophaga]|uniref:relaxase/mobilization nuclease domain-containing protein n=1 Tax=unclassified Chitinophaga TaxID=2619133 RepID=UPI0030100E54
MTADQVKGKGFRGALRYNLEKVEKGVAEFLDSNFAELSEKNIMKEVAIIKSLRPNLQKYFYHTSLNFPPEEDMSNEKMLTIAKDYLEQNGFTEHQFIIFRHRDADHPHLHILVNRIGFDGKVLSDSRDYARSEKVIRELEIKYNLAKVQSSSQAKERAMTKNELEMMKRTDEISTKMKLQAIIKNTLSQHLTTAKFIESLQNRGVNILFNQAKTGFVSGISYGYEGMIFKGATLGNAYKWSNIKSIIGYEQERDYSAIYQANIRTKSSNSTNGLGEDTLTNQRNSNLVPSLSRPIQGRTTKAPSPIKQGVSKYISALEGYSPSVGKPGIFNERFAWSSFNEVQTAKEAGDFISGIIRDLLSPVYVNYVEDLAVLNRLKKKKKRRRKGI